MDETGNGSKYMWNPVITATYFPTSYGTVTTVAQDPGGFTDVEAVQFEDQEGGGISTVYHVDLRVLELQAAKARAEAEAAQRRLVEARLQKQMQSSRQSFDERR